MWLKYLVCVFVGFLFRSVFFFFFRIKCIFDKAFAERSDQFQIVPTLFIKFSTYLRSYHSRRSPLVKQVQQLIGNRKISIQICVVEMCGTIAKVHFLTQNLWIRWFSSGQIASYNLFVQCSTRAECNQADDDKCKLNFENEIERHGSYTKQISKIQPNTWELQLKLVNQSLQWTLLFSRNRKTKKISP